MSDTMRREIVTYGPTLARPMNWEESIAIIGVVTDASPYAAIVVSLGYTRDPLVMDVNCAVDDNIDPQTAIVGLVTAARRLAHLHGAAANPVIIDGLEQVDDLRRTAEDLVDFCRSCRLSRAGELMMRGYDRSREDCVQEVLSALLGARVSPEALLASIAALPPDVAREAAMPAREGGA